MLKIDQQINVLSLESCMALAKVTFKFDFYPKGQSQYQTAYKRVPLDCFPPVGLEYEVADKLMVVSKVRKTKDEGTVAFLIEADKKQIFNDPRPSSMTSLNLSQEQLQMIKEEGWIIE